MPIFPRVDEASSRIFRGARQRPTRLAVIRWSLLVTLLGYPLRFRARHCGPGARNHHRWRMAGIAGAAGVMFLSVGAVLSYWDYRRL